MVTSLSKLQGRKEYSPAMQFLKSYSYELEVNSLLHFGVEE
jgi:hypothetical protein